MNMMLTPEQLEERAQESRSRLLRTVDEIDRRRHELMDLAIQARKVLVPVAIATGVVVLAMGAAIGYVVRSARRSGPYGTYARVAAGRRAWTHPERVAAPGQSSLVRRIGSAAVTAAVSMLASALVGALVSRVTGEHGKKTTPRGRPDYR